LRKKADGTGILGALGIIMQNLASKETRMKKQKESRNEDKVCIRQQKNIETGDGIRGGPTELVEEFT